MTRNSRQDMFKCIVVGVVLMAGLLRAEELKEYCELCADHTMCIYPGVGPTCQPQLSNIVDERDQTIILSAHNRVRSAVATGRSAGSKGELLPTASDMNMLYWNDELATVAQRWADQCTPGYDACHKVRELGPPSAGQNVYMQESSEDSPMARWSAAIYAWRDQGRMFDKNDVKKYKVNNATRHYTQLIWAETNQVGCGYSYYKVDADNLYHMFYVCNYHPAGNKRRRPVYTVGETCKDCSKCSDNRRYQGLCVNE